MFVSLFGGPLLGVGVFLCRSPDWVYQGRRCLSGRSHISEGSRVLGLGVRDGKRGLDVPFFLTAAHTTSGKK